MRNVPLPRILIIDDLFGRTLRCSRNEQRANLCSRFLLRDCTGDAGTTPSQQIEAPIAEAVFHRGQQPACASVGDTVENDLPGVLNFVREGFRPGGPCWSLALLDLCFYTGDVTKESDGENEGMPAGRGGDDEPQGYFGLQILKVLQREVPDLPVIILSSQPREDVSRAFSRLGGLGFLDRAARESPAQLKDYIFRYGLLPDQEGRLIGRSLALLLALRRARLASRSGKNILIFGERGSGKELLAEYVNRHSAGGPRCPFVKVDAGGLSAELYSSALFGHRKGAFTDARANKVGAIVEADGGDLFLDEIGNMPGAVQLGLLRVLQEREVMPLGGTSADLRKVNVRFLSATNGDLDAAARSGTFRSDILDRLRQEMFCLPPLRDRKEDIVLLAEHYVRRALSHIPGALGRDIEPEALARLLDYDWPGNVRELENCIVSAVAHHPDVEHLQPNHLEIPSHPAKSTKHEVPPQTTQVTFPVGDMSLDDVVTMLDNVDFSRIPREQWAGRIEELETAWARFMARYLKAGLEASRRPAVKNPTGELFLLPALQLLTGNATLKAWQAYDKIKAICQLTPQAEVENTQDPVLGDILARAKRSRRGR